MECCQGTTESVQGRRMIQRKLVRKTGMFPCLPGRILTDGISGAAPRDATEGFPDGACGERLLSFSGDFSAGAAAGEVEGVRTFGAVSPAPF